MCNFYPLTPNGFEEGTQHIAIGKYLLCGIDKRYMMTCWKLGNTSEYIFRVDEEIMEVINYKVK